MRDILIQGTNLAVSRFIFGTASLFNVGRTRDRQRLLSAAADAGFSHFDTAPYYGFGVAERELGALLKVHRNITVTTKVGLYSPGGESQPAAAVFARKVVGRLFKPASRPALDFSLERARRSLEGSLGRLGRERIDLYTLHEAELPLIRTDEWQRWLERCVAEGKVRHFGLAVTADRLKPFLDAKSGLTEVIQVADSLEEREADLLAQYGRPMQITYAYVSAALKRGSTEPIPEILKKALLRNHQGAVIVSSTKVSRLPQYARIAEEASRAP